MCTFLSQSYCHHLPAPAGGSRCMWTLELPFCKRRTTLLSLSSKHVNPQHPCCLNVFGPQRCCGVNLTQHLYPCDNLSDILYSSWCLLFPVYFKAPFRPWKDTLIKYRLYLHSRTADQVSFNKHSSSPPFSPPTVGVSCPWCGTADQKLISEFTLVVRAPVLLPSYF